MRYLSQPVPRLLHSLPAVVEGAVAEAADLIGAVELGTFVTQPCSRKEAARTQTAVSSGQRLKCKPASLVWNHGSAQNGLPARTGRMSVPALTRMPAGPRS